MSSSTLQAASYEIHYTTSLVKLDTNNTNLWCNCHVCKLSDHTVDMQELHSLNAHSCISFYGSIVNTEVYCN